MREWVAEAEGLIFVLLCYSKLGLYKLNFMHSKHQYSTAFWNYRYSRAITYLHRNRIFYCLKSLAIGP